MVVHHPSQWPMIDEYGIDVHPGMYTAAAISEVKVSKYILLYRRKNWLNYYTQDFANILYKPNFAIQLKMERQPSPYKANCVSTWTSTNLTGLVEDPEEDNEAKGKPKRNQIKYNLAVRFLFQKS